MKISRNYGIDVSLMETHRNSKDVQPISLFFRYSLKSKHVDENLTCLDS